MKMYVSKYALTKGVIEVEIRKFDGRRRQKAGCT
jgi:hypothetical protein